MDGSTPSLAIRVRVVLVRPAQARNVGACVRAAANFGAESVRVVGVQPDDEWTREARVASSGGWDAVPVVFTASLDEALAGCQHAAALSARRRADMAPPESPRNFVSRMIAAAGLIALVLGPESQGLSREECLRCGALLRIPSVADFGSLNLSQAVAVMLYEFAATATPPSAEPPAIAPDESREQTLRRAESLLLKAGALPPPPRDSAALAQLRRLIEHAAPSPGDLALMDSIIRSLSQDIWGAEKKVAKSDDQVGR